MMNHAVRYMAGLREDGGNNLVDSKPIWALRQENAPARVPSRFCTRRRGLPEVNAETGHGPAKNLRVPSPATGDRRHQENANGPAIFRQARRFLRGFRKIQSPTAFTI